MQHHSRLASGQSPHLFNTSLSRRSACDRCRGQKLRCNRDPNGPINGPCLRCKKAGEPCGISSSHRLVRSRPSSARERSAREQPHEDIGPDSPTNSRASGLHSRTESMISTHLSEPLGPGQASGQLQLQGGNIPSHQAQMGNMQLLQDWGVDMLGTGYPEAQTHFDHTQRSGFESEERPTQGFVHTSTSLNTPEEVEEQTNVPGAQTPFLLPASNLSGFDHSHTFDTHHVAAGRAFQADTQLTGLYSASSERSPPHAGYLSTSPLVEQAVDDPNAASGSWNPNSATSDFTGLSHAAIRKLSILNRELMNDLNRMSFRRPGGGLGGVLTHDRSSLPSLKDEDGSISRNMPMGRMLYNSEKFLEVLRYLENHTGGPLQRSLSESSQDDPLASPDTSDGSDPSSARGTQERVNARWSMLEDYLQGNMNETQQAALATNWEPRSLPLAKMEVSTILVVLSCYICLLKIFEAVFHRFLDSVRSMRSTKVQDHILSGVEASTSQFSMTEYHLPELRLFVEVSNHFLDSISIALGFPSNRGGSMYADSTFQSLLAVILKEEGMNQTGENATGMARIKVLMNKARVCLL